ncbi:hypothetical protein NHX12_021436 [Muraenolepis orangiensis]|uniref:Uncharacterized protein n=1 Tax=Muraenolepis orangiensis TaxID=630683 RepID=A0A9Q0EQI0_9TELE|nr:hypothetical protein NHX12_021436 [Muraenolepis orangiensis]
MASVVTQWEPEMNPLVLQGPAPCFSSPEVCPPRSGTLPLHQLKNTIRHLGALSRRKPEPQEGPPGEDRGRLRINRYTSESSRLVE